MFDIFNALKYTPYSDVKAVILGQDPYHQPGQAHGLCFSVKRGVPPPPSLLNIFKELQSDLDIQPQVGKTGVVCGELTDWAKNGVLLLNTALTVRQNEANSHKGVGWEIFTDKIIELLNQRESPMVFILWGANAQTKRSLLFGTHHLVLTGSHPSPLSANRGGFFGGEYFSKTNSFLQKFGINEINWRITP
jgi:uracil-DNA glycosylase